MDQIGIFLVILVACLVFFMLSAVFGGDTSGADADVMGGDHDGVVFTSNVLTIRNFFLFGVGFGASGVIATYLGSGGFAASIWGVGAGVVMVIVGVWFYSLVRRQESNTVANPAILVGKHAVVTTPIPDGGRGEIMTSNEFSATVHLAAQSPSGAVPTGTEVVVVSVVGNVATVQASSSKSPRK